MDVAGLSAVNASLVVTLPFAFGQAMGHPIDEHIR